MSSWGMAAGRARVKKAWRVPRAKSTSCGTGTWCCSASTCERQVVGEEGVVDQVRRRVDELAHLLGAERRRLGELVPEENVHRSCPRRRVDVRSGARSPS